MIRKTIRCTQCHNFKEYNTFDLCLICYTKTKSDNDQNEIINSPKYNALKKLQETYKTDEDLLNSKSFIFEMSHNPATFQNSEQALVRAFNETFERIYTFFRLDREALALYKQGK